MVMLLLVALTPDKSKTFLELIQKLGYFEEAYKKALQLAV